MGPLENTPAFLPYTGKLAFVVLRQQFHTVQAVADVDETVSKAMIKFIARCGPPPPASTHGGAGQH